VLFYANALSSMALGQQIAGAHVLLS